MTIDPQRLIKLRKQRRLSRRRLAEKSKISLRQIARLESDKVAKGNVREHTLGQLAKALDVEPGVLTGELPMPESAPRPPERERLQVSALMRSEVRLAYDLIKQRYGVIPTTIINMAPLFFVLLAEGSRAWRREKAQAMHEIGALLYDLGREAPHLTLPYDASGRAREWAIGENEAIEKGDLFGEHFEECLETDLYDYYDQSKNNPFADYLRKLAQMIDDRIVKIDPILDDLGYPAPDFPNYVVCGGDLKKITGGSFDAEFALTQGQTRLSEIPDELWADDATGARAKWLGAQISDEMKQFLGWDLLENDEEVGGVK